MKKISQYISGFALACLVWSCKKEIKPVAVYNVPSATDAKLKINFNSNYRSNPNVQLSVNDVRVSNLLTARTPFPGGGYNTGGDSRPDYLNFDAGARKVSVAIPKTGTNMDSVGLFNTNVTLQSGKYYTLHITDTAANTKSVLVEDDATEAPRGFSKFKFVNLMPNVPALDFYYGTTLIAQNVTYLSSTPTILMAVPATALAWNVRETGTSPTSTVLATYTSASTTLSTRSYTGFAVGYKGITATTDARRPFVAFFLNR